MIFKRAWDCTTEIYKPLFGFEISPSFEQRFLPNTKLVKATIKSDINLFIDIFGKMT